MWARKLGAPDNVNPGDGVNMSPNLSMYTIPAKFLGIDSYDTNYNHAHAFLYASPLKGASSKDSEVIAYSSDDAERVEPLWLASLDELLQLLLPYAKMSVNDNGTEYLMTMPANWDDAHTDSLEQLSHNYVATAFVARWLDAVKPDSAMLMRSLNNNTAMAIKELMYKRKIVKR